MANEGILAANNFLDVEFKVVSVVKSNSQESDFEKYSVEEKADPAFSFFIVRRNFKKLK
jgi:hypothetical protein